MSYQPEERYWTDYLRIALPVVGLLLMLSLFWFWAANLIGDDDDDEPPATLSAQNDTTPEPSPTVFAAAPTATTAGGGATEGATEVATEVDTDEATEPPTEPAEETEPPEDDGDGGDEPTQGNGVIEVGDEVIVVDNDVNFRAEPSTTADVIRVLANGEELTITGESVEAENFVWWQAEDVDGNEGYVAADFLEEAPAS